MNDILTDSEQYIELEQIRFLYKQVILSVAANISIAFLLLLALWQSADQQLLLIWYIAIILIAVFRLGLYATCRHFQLQAESMKLWKNLYIVSIFISGLSWGSAALLFLPADNIAVQAIITFTIVGISTGAANIYASLHLAYLAFIVPAMSMLLFQLLWVGGSHYSMLMSAMVMIGFLFFLNAAKTLHSHLQENIVLRMKASRLNEAKSLFLSNMSHELRTPLNAIIGFTQLLQLDVHKNLVVQQHEQLDEIEKASQHLLKLINKILDLSKIESGQYPVSLEPVNVCELIEENLRLIQPLAEQRQIQILNHCCLADQNTANTELTSDKAIIAQILINLLSNAVKYNKKNGTIEVICKIKKQGKQAFFYIEIKDTGSGIEKEKLPLLFRPFERLGLEHSGIDGSGIGLSHSKELITLIQGQIGVQSRLGQGSSFWIKLPLELQGDNF